MSDRKYRQRGYQDQERPAARPSGPRAERPEGPRGRGLGAPSAEVFRCAACGRQVEGLIEVAASAACPACRAPLHTCSHCRHFDPSAPKECREPVAERIAKKSAANLCALFAPRTAQEFAAEPTRPPDDPRSAFDALFKS